MKNKTDFAMNFQFCNIWSLNCGSLVLQNILWRYIIFLTPSNHLQLYKYFVAPNCANSAITEKPPSLITTSSSHSFLDLMFNTFNNTQFAPSNPNLNVNTNTNTNVNVNTNLNTNTNTNTNVNVNLANNHTTQYLNNNSANTYGNGNGNSNGNLPVVKFNLIAAIQKQLSQIPQQTLLDFCRKLFPVQINRPNVYNSLYRTLMQYFVIQSHKNIAYQDTVAEVIRIAGGVSQGLAGRIRELLKREEVRGKIQENINSVINPSFSNNSSSLSSSTTVGNQFPKKSHQYSTSSSTALLQNLGHKYDTISHKYTSILQREQLNDTFRKDPTNNINGKQIKQDSAIIAQKFIRDRALVQNLVRKMDIQKQLRQKGRLSEKKCIICQIGLGLNQNFSIDIKSYKNLMECKDCGEIYHNKCMPRSNNCSICQLKNINPLQKTRTTLFVGILKKNTKRHQIQFQILKSHLQCEPSTEPQPPTISPKKPQPSSSSTPISSTPVSSSSTTPLTSPLSSTSSLLTIQLRSLRLKPTSDPVSSFINLFPDACTITINSRLIKQFQPLHKQSSLKYRRDQCIKINSYVNVGGGNGNNNGGNINKAVIVQRIGKKDIKGEERIQPENHLIGVYVVQSVAVPRQANKLEMFLTKSGYMSGNNPTNIQKFLEKLQLKQSGFQKSQQLLKQSLFISAPISSSKPTAQQSSIMQPQPQPQPLIPPPPPSSSLHSQPQLLCDSIKVPLICSLTLQKMKFPGRSIFCRHFTCFDVYNFILLNSQAKLPKWQCPICKSAAYKFQIDSIMASVLGELTKISQSASANNKKSIKQQQQVSQLQFNHQLNIKFINNQGNLLINKDKKLVKSYSKDNKIKQKNIAIGRDIIQSQLVPYWIQNIYDLNIQGKCKRDRVVDDGEEIWEGEIGKKGGKGGSVKKDKNQRNIMKNIQSQVKIKKINIQSQDEGKSGVTKKSQQQKQSRFNQYEQKKLLKSKTQSQKLPSATAPNINPTPLQNKPTNDQLLSFTIQIPTFEPSSIKPQSHYKPQTTSPISTLALNPSTSKPTNITQNPTPLSIPTPAPTLNNTNTNTTPITMMNVHNIGKISISTNNQQQPSSVNYVSISMSQTSQVKEQIRKMNVNQYSNNSNNSNSNHSNSNHSNNSNNGEIQEKAMTAEKMNNNNQINGKEFQVQGCRMMSQQEQVQMQLALQRYEQSRKLKNMTKQPSTQQISEQTIMRGQPILSNLAPQPINNGYNNGYNQPIAEIPSSSYQSASDHQQRQREKQREIQEQVIGNRQNHANQNQNHNENDNKQGQKMVQKQNTIEEKNRNIENQWWNNFKQNLQNQKQFQQFQDFQPNYPNPGKNDQIQLQKQQQKIKQNTNKATLMLNQDQQQKQMNKTMIDEHPTIPKSKKPKSRYNYQPSDDLFQSFTANPQTQTQTQGNPKQTSSKKKSNQADPSCPPTNTNTATGKTRKAQTQLQRQKIKQEKRKNNQQELMMINYSKGGFIDVIELSD